MNQPYLENALDQPTTPALDMSAFICTFAFDSSYKIKDLRTNTLYAIGGVYQAFNRNNEIRYALLPLTSVCDSPLSQTDVRDANKLPPGPAIVAARWVTQQELLVAVCASPSIDSPAHWEVIPPVSVCVDTHSHTQTQDTHSHTQTQTRDTHPV